MAEEKREGVQEDKGTPTEKQASESKEPTTPPPGQPLTLDITKQYVIDKQGNTMFGQQLVQEANRGKLASKFQSDFHKKDEEFKKTLAEKESLESELQQLRYEIELQANLKKLGLLGNTSDNNDTQETFFDTEPVEKSQLDPQALVRQIESLVDAKVKQKLGDPENLVRQIYDNEKQERDRQDRYNRHINSIVSTRRASLRDQFPNLPDASLDSITQMEQAIMVGRAQADKLAAEGDDDQALEIFGQAEAMLQEQIRLLAEAEIERRKAEQQAELEQQLETGAVGEVPEGPPPKKINWKPSDKKNADKQRLEEALKIQSNARRAMQALGNIPAKVKGFVK